MDIANVGKMTTWGNPSKTGVIVALVPAGTRVSAIRTARSLDKGCRFEEDASRNDRYLVRVDREGKAPKWYAAKAVDIDAAIRADDAVAPYWTGERRALCLRLEDAQKGHPKPELVKKLEAEVDAFDRAHPTIRNAPQAHAAVMS